MYQARIYYPDSDLGSTPALVYPAGEPFPGASATEKCILCDERLVVQGEYRATGARRLVSTFNLANGRHLGFVVDEAESAMHMRCVLDATELGALRLTIG